jgi:hypothetical protein
LAYFFAGQKVWWRTKKDKYKVCPKGPVAWGGGGGGGLKSYLDKIHLNSTYRSMGIP